MNGRLGTDDDDLQRRQPRQRDGPCELDDHLSDGGPPLLTGIHSFHQGNRVVTVADGGYCLSGLGTGGARNVAGRCNSRKDTEVPLEIGFDIIDDLGIRCIATQRSFEARLDQTAGFRVR
jgi:hypothetical protein